MRYTVSGVSWRFRRYGVKLKPGRPRNPKQKAAEAEAFKKTPALVKRYEGRVFLG
jgi:hypothetical protein